MDLEAEAYQLFCFMVLNAFQVWMTYFVKRLIISLDRRITAVFSGDGIELFVKSQDDLIAKAYYTATISNILNPSIVAQRLGTAINRVKCAYILGNNYAYDRDESRLFSNPKSLVDRLRDLPLASLQCNQADVLALLKVATVFDLRWHGDHSFVL